LTIPSGVEELHDDCIGVTFKLLEVLCLLLTPAAPRAVCLTTLLVASVVVLLLISLLLEGYIFLLVYLEKQRNNGILNGLQSPVTVQLVCSGHKLFNYVRIYIPSKAIMKRNYIHNGTTL
jgi:hypothetical protein